MGNKKDITLKVKQDIKKWLRDEITYLEIAIRLNRSHMTITKEKH